MREDSPASAERFGSSLLNHIELLQNFPRIGVQVPGRPGIRKILHTPVRVYYRLDERLPFSCTRSALIYVQLAKVPKHDRRR